METADALAVALRTMAPESHFSLGHIDKRTGVPKTRRFRLTATRFRLREHDVATHQRDLAVEFEHKIDFTVAVHVTLKEGVAVLELVIDWNTNTLVWLKAIYTRYYLVESCTGRLVRAW
jgi:hypothetical protein